MLRSQRLIPLLGGAYKTRNAIGSDQVCENLFLENNPETTSANAPTTHYPREGERPLSSPPTIAPGRGVFTLSNGALFAVAGQIVYYIDNDWKWNQLGTLSQQANTPVSIADNGKTAVIVDASKTGFQVDLATHAFSQIIDTTGLFTGSIRVDYADTFFAFATPGTNIWYVSEENEVTFNALMQAAKSTTPDAISTFAYNQRQMWLLGAVKSSEVWYNAGATPFPYAEWPNIQVMYGCAAPYSLVRADVDLFWLARNDQGQAIAVKTHGYAVQEISTMALNYEWSTYSTVADCVGGTFQQSGHTFIIFHFPSADRTWAYDLATQQWHRRTYTDQNGVGHREKVAFYASVGAVGGYPKTIVGQDWQTGQIYALDPAYYTDNGQPIVCRRSFPHQMTDMLEVTHVSFVADFATGGVVGTTEQINGSDFNNDFNNDFGPAGQFQDNPTSLSMRYSNDGGKTWSNWRQKAMVTAGNYRSMMRYRGLGMARDRIYELEWSFNGPSALNGAYIEPIVHGA